jgi:hypothetical protein
MEGGWEQEDVWREEGTSNYKMLCVSEVEGGLKPRRRRCMFSYFLGLGSYYLPLI